MNLSQLRARVRSLTGILSTNVLTDAELNAFINEAYTSVLAQRDWPFLRSTTNGQSDPTTQSITIENGPMTITKIDRAYVVDGPWPRELFPLDGPEDVTEYNETPDRPRWYGQPYSYEGFIPGLVTNSIPLIPPPVEGETIVLDVVIAATPLAADTDQPVIPESYRHAIAYVAAASVLEREADATGRVAAFGQHAGAIIGDMERELMTSSRRSFRLGGRLRLHRRNARIGRWS